LFGGNTPEPPLNGEGWERREGRGMEGRKGRRGWEGREGGEERGGRMGREGGTTLNKIWPHLGPPSEHFLAPPLVAVPLPALIN
jgi:hypothetical protein